MNVELLPMSKRLLSCSEAADILAVSDETVRRWFHEGTLSGVRLTGSTIRIHTESVSRLIDGGAK